MFSLVSSDDPELVFALGMEISHGDDIEAVIYRHDPTSGHSMTGMHASAEAALMRWSMLTPLDLLWEDEEEEVDSLTT